jgi:tetratricopeptide (TPR) repeat protein/tRNA A-37 threonylcarbamoyl transferase component Bud32
LLGAGGFASVWSLREDRVIKIAHASHELARARLVREAEALRAIGAPWVPACHDSGVLPDGRAWIVMERVDGVTLSDITAEGQMRSADAVELGLAILEPLEHVGAAGFVHRDIKPDNLVRTASGRVVILDLGLARKIPTDPDDPTRANVQVGSLEYIAPEQIADSANVDVRTDLYAFGCVLFELLAARPPFIGDAAALERAHTALRPPRLGALRSAPAAIESLLADCLAKEPARRPASIAEVRGRLAVARDERTPAKMQHSVSVIREGKQPVVLLFAELPRVDRALLGMLTARRLVVASQRGRRVLAGVLGGEHADPASIAIAAARDLAAAGARVALHLDAIRVGSAGGASTLQGESVEKPETWVPQTPWTGVVLTLSLASVTQAPTCAADGLGPGFRALGDEQSTIDLVGREGLLTDLVADAATALHGLANANDPGTTGRRRRESTSAAVWRTSGPAFALLLGDAGVGKTAFAAELGKRLAQLGVRVHLATVPAPGAGKPGHSALEPIVGTPQGPIVRAYGDALRDVAREKPTAVILDDLHLADHDLLDALEYATLGGEPLPLWVLGIAAPRLDARRPNLGVRAERHRRDILPALDEDAAVTLTAALLKPAEYPPLRALRRLGAIAHGNPLHLVMLAREIHQRGAVRERAGGAFFLDTSALDDIAPIALGPWLAARELAGVSVETVALARVCAVLSGDLERAELVAIVEAVEKSGGATTTVDVDVGLAELVQIGVLERTGTRHRFTQALVEEGIYSTTHEDERLALHRAALAYFDAKPLDSVSTAETVARHADAVGDAATAARAYAALGALAEREHRTLDADQAWTGAIRHLERTDVASARAMLGRARARYRLQRVRDALKDLDDAIAVAHDVGDPDLELEASIERATALDWADDFEESARTAARSRELLPRSDRRDLAVDVDLAEARSLFRAQQFASAEPRLRDVRISAHALGRHDAEIIAALLHSTVLVDLGRYDEAQHVFDELIPLCVARDDRFHLGVAYANRSWLWSSQGEVERCNDDLRTVIQLARESGHASVERIATYNLGEALLWQGTHDEALRLAERSAKLQSGHGEGAAKLDQFLIARVLAAKGDLAELAELLAVLGAATLSDSERVTFDVLSCAASGAPGTQWADVLRSRGDHLTVEMRLELSHLAARRGGFSPEELAELRTLQASHPLWSKLPTFSDPAAPGPT